MIEKKLAIVFPGSENTHKEHMQRLVDKYHVLAVAPETMLINRDWVIAMTGTENYIPVPFTVAAIGEGASKVREWEYQHGAIDGVMPLTESAVEYTAALIEALNETRSNRSKLRGTSLHTAQIIRNKSEFRRLVTPFSNNIKSVLLKGPADVENARTSIAFPAVIKPTKGVGSICVRKIASFDNLQASFHDLFNELQSSNFANDVKQMGFVLEEFFDGEEVDVDGWACHGSIQFSMVSDNVLADAADFHDSGGYYPSQLPAPKLEALQKLTEDVVNTLGDMHGVFHFEARVNNNLEVFPIEMNARAGGAVVAYAVEATSGYHLHSVHAQLAVGEPVTMQSEVRHEVVVSRFLHHDAEDDLLGIDHKDLDEDDSLDLVVIRYLGKPRHYLPDRGAESCLCWMAVGSRDVTEAKQKIARAESLIQYNWKEST